MSSSVQQLNVRFGGSVCFKVSLTSGDATTIPQLLEAVRAQWGAEAVDLSGLKLTWEPPSHISLGAIDVSAPEHRGKTVAQLGMWDLDTLQASVECSGCGAEAGAAGGFLFFGDSVVSAEHLDGQPAEAPGLARCGTGCISPCIFPRGWC